MKYLFKRFERMKYTIMIFEDTVFSRIKSDFFEDETENFFEDEN